LYIETPGKTYKQMQAEDLERIYRSWPFTDSRGSYEKLTFRCRECDCEFVVTPEDIQIDAATIGYDGNLLKAKCPNAEAHKHSWNFIHYERVKRPLWQRLLGWGEWRDGQYETND
jgi:hypothetical protein